jgi:preprotein translocase subunit SecY
MLTTWLGELITKEKLGNGSSMIIFMNIVSGLPSNLTQFSFDNLSSIKNLSSLFISYLVYFGIVILVVLVQDSYKKVQIVSAKQLNFNSLEQSFVSSKLKNGYIPLKLNQGGIMPLVFSTTIATLILVPLRTIFSNVNLLTLFTFVLNLILVVFFSAFYALLVLNPKDLSTNLTKMSYNLPGLKQGKATTRYLEQAIVRLALLGGIFLAFLTFFPLIVGNVFKFNLFKNLTSLIFLIGVITDVTSQVKGYLISRNYEGLKNP